MSGDWVEDIAAMQRKFGVDQAVIKMSPELLRDYLGFRMRFLDEEFTETVAAYDGSYPEEFVDGLIDFMVVAIGTLLSFGVDPREAWDKVHAANMSKKPGVKEGRPNPLGLPDLVKPEGWRAPDHSDNVGSLRAVMGVEE